MRKVVQPTLPNPFVEEKEKQRGENENEAISIRDSTVPPLAIRGPEDPQTTSHRNTTSIESEIEDDIEEDLILFDKSSDFKH